MDMPSPIAQETFTNKDESKIIYLSTVLLEGWMSPNLDNSNCYETMIFDNSNPPLIKDLDNDLFQWRTSNLTKAKKLHRAIAKKIEDFLNSKISTTDFIKFLHKIDHIND